MATLRCPRCLSRKIRDGSFIKGYKGEEFEVRSLDGDMYSCLDCNRDGFLQAFQSDCPDGCLEIRDESKSTPTGSSVVPLPSLPAEHRLAFSC